MTRSFQSSIEFVRILPCNVLGIRFDNATTVRSRQETRKGLTEKEKTVWGVLKKVGMDSIARFVPLLLPRRFPCVDAKPTPNWAQSIRLGRLGSLL